MRAKTKLAVIAGTPGTLFSTCVSDMAKATGGSATNPAKELLKQQAGG